MPQLLPPRPAWQMLRPWTYPTRWSRFFGTFCLFALIIEGIALFLDWSGGLWLSVAMVMLLSALISVDMVRNLRDMRRFKHTMKTLTLWSKLIDGKIDENDLTPEQREDIAVQRAKAAGDR